MDNKIFTLSIIIPVYNLRNYINDCVNSILPQLSSDVEIIIVDDGSSDGSSELCDTFTATNIVVLHQSNQGVSIARNNGLKKSRGRYIFYVDGDDLLAPSSIEKIKEKIKSSNADIISGSFVKFYNQIDKDLSKKSINSHTILSIESKQGHDAFEEIIKKEIFLPSMCNNICKRDLFFDNDIFFESSLVNNEDIDCAMKLYMCADTIGILEKPHYYYRQSRPGSACSTYTELRVENSLDFIESWRNKTRDMRDASTLKPWIASYLLYQYSIALGSIFLSPEEGRPRLLRKARILEGLLQHGLTRNTKFIGILGRVLGIKTTGNILARIIRIKTLVNKYV